MTVCVTGASGFVGQSLCRALKDSKHSVRGTVRSLNSVVPIHGMDCVAVGEINAISDWTSALAGADCVIHCAARAHVMHETKSDSLEMYRLVNVEGSRNLAEQAAAAGVRRFVFLSSIGVLGIHTNERGPFSISEVPNPVDDYAISKWEAEKALREVETKTGLELVVVRPPLIYGPNAKGNLARLLKLVLSGVPLPLGAVKNQRSLIGLDNLIDLLIRCVDYPSAAGQILLVSDGEDVSTPDLLRHMAAAFGQSTRLIPMPVPLLHLVSSAIGKRAEIERLIGSLQIDSSHTRKLLDWTPPVSVLEGIRRMGQGA